jgi:hypothetical protein
MSAAWKAQVKLRYQIIETADGYQAYKYHFSITKNIRKFNCWPQKALTIYLYSYVGRIPQATIITMVNGRFPTRSISRSENDVGI